MFFWGSQKSYPTQRSLFFLRGCVRLFCVALDTSLLLSLFPRIGLQEPEALFAVQAYGGRGLLPTALFFPVFCLRGYHHALPLLLHTTRTVFSRVFILTQCHHPEGKDLDKIDKETGIQVAKIISTRVIYSRSLRVLMFLFPLNPPQPSSLLFPRRIPLYYDARKITHVTELA